jgi:tRNA threonylcarbamoyladenosine biosynthesis protein TsaB
MSIIGLCIETSDEICSVALRNEEGDILTKKSLEPKSHASSLNLLIENLLKESAITFEQIKYIAISRGPGSYTGLRIGTSTAKGLCFALDIPLISVDTFDILRAQIRSTRDCTDKRLVAMIDARRAEVYAFSWSKTGSIEMNSKAIVLDKSFLEKELELADTIYFGSGAFKMNDIDEVYSFNTTDLRPQAEDMVFIAEKKYIDNNYEDLAYFEPFYLKEFYITKAKNSLTVKNGK